MKNPIYPCMWFDQNAKEAAEFYCSVFKDSKITSKNPFVVNFELEGQKFIGLNGGPMYTPNPSISFFVVLETKNEVEDCWKQLSEGGNVLMPLDSYGWSEKYGWVQDRFGVSWQLYFGKMEDVGQRFTPLLTFTKEQAGKAEEAINYYSSVFEDSSIMGISKYSAEDPDVEGTVKHAQFHIGGSVFMAMDSSLPHQFKFNEGISLVIECEDQEEIDYYWETLTKDGEESMCGWLTDRYGVSWQIIPAILGELMSDPAKAQQVSQVYLKMKKFEIEPLIKAYES